MTSARRTLLSPNLTKGLIFELILNSNCCGKEDEPSSLIFNIRAAKGNEWKDNWREFKDFEFSVDEFRIRGTVGSVNKFIQDSAGQCHTQEFYSIFDNIMD